MNLERIIWKENHFTKESNGQVVKPSPIGEIFSSYHAEGLDYVDDVANFLRKEAEFYIKKNQLSQVNAFQGTVINAQDGGDYTILQLYIIE